MKIIFDTEEMANKIVEFLCSNDPYEVKDEYNCEYIDGRMYSQELFDDVLYDIDECSCFNTIDKLKEMRIDEERDDVICEIDYLLEELELYAQL